MEPQAGLAMDCLLLLIFFAVFGIPVAAGLVPDCLWIGGNSHERGDGDVGDI